MFKILHLSDLHISSRPRPSRQGGGSSASDLTVDDVFDGVRRKLGASVASPVIADRLARFVRRMRDAQNLILVSGDLADTGSGADLSLARQYLFSGSSLPLPGAGLLQVQCMGLSERKVFLMPGNHDRYRDIYGVVACREFDRVFATHWPTPGWGIHRARLTDKSTGASLVIVAGDFCLRAETDAWPPSVLYRYGQGYAYSDVIANMIRSTDDARDKQPGPAVVWMSHFPPMHVDDDPLQKLRLRCHHDLLDAAARSKVKYVISGHVHMNATQDRKGVRILIGGAGCTHNERLGNWAHLLEFDVRQGRPELIKRENYKLDEFVGNFTIG